MPKGYFRAVLSSVVDDVYEADEYEAGYMHISEVKAISTIYEDEVEGVP